jgi:phosphate/sulfate permease
MGPEHSASEWLAAAKEGAINRAKAEAVAEGTSFSAEQLEPVEIGVMAGIFEMIGLMRGDYLTA